MLESEFESEFENNSTTISTLGMGVGVSMRMSMVASEVKVYVRKVRSDPDQRRTIRLDVIQKTECS